MSNQVEVVVNQASIPTVAEVTAPGPQGPTGPAGATGASTAWRQGAGAPISGTGVNGDYYLDTTTGDVYGPKEAGAWGSSIFNIAEGQQGPAGVDGEPGAEVILEASATHIRWRRTNSVSEVNRFNNYEAPVSSVIVEYLDSSAWIERITDPRCFVGGVELSSESFIIEIEEENNAARCTFASPITSPSRVSVGFTWDALQWENLIPLSDLAGDPGADGADGVDGREIELRAGLTHVQWRYVGVDPWQNLVPLADITGPQGPQGVAGPAGAAGAQGPAGADGSSAYQVAVAAGFAGTEAQWLASLIGPQGPQGATGAQGATGPQGPQGDTGDTGPQGPAGATGSAGVVAATAPLTYNSGTQTVGISVGTTAGTVAAGDDARITGALSAATAEATYQPLDADLTAIAALSTASVGRSLLTMSSLGAGLTFTGGVLYLEPWFGFACSDETSNITTGTGKLRFRMPFACTLLAVVFEMNTAPTGSAAVFDLNEGGVSVFSTNPRIDINGTDSSASGTPAVISDSSIAAGAVMTVDFDQVGATEKGKGVKMWINVRRTA